jgi:predicted permease
MSMLRFFRRRSEDEDLAQEIQSHIAHEIDENIARGLSSSEAARRAYLKFGNPHRVREKVWQWNTVEVLHSLSRDLGYAVRAFFRQPGFFAAAVFTMALGVGATTVMFTLISSVLLKPLEYPAPERLVTVHQQTEKYGDQWGFSYLDFLDCQRESRMLDMAAWTYGGGTITAPGEAEYVHGRQISHELFAVLGIGLLRGRPFLPEEDLPDARPIVIISYGLWQQRYSGNPAAIGMKLDFDGKMYDVIGVTAPGFELGGDADVFVPLGQNTEPRMQVREADFLHVVARLRHGSTLAAAQAELAHISRNLADQYPASNNGHSFTVESLRQELVEDVRSTLWLLLGAVSLLLMIACANVASLLLSRAVSRDREFAVRVALGAGQSRLLRQCLTESAVLGLAGGVLGVLLAATGIHPFLLLWPGGLPRTGEVRLDWRVLLFTLGISLLSGLLFGLAPALRAHARDLEQVLRAGSRSIARSPRRLHSVFVSSEIALAVVLLVCAGMLARTLLRLSFLSPGLNVQDVLVARIAFSPTSLTNPAQARAAWQQLLDSTRRVPGVQSAALTDTVPMREGINELGYWTTLAEPPRNQIPLAVATGVSQDYLKVMGIPLREGRFFNDQDRLGSMPVVVIDEVLAQHAFAGHDAVGKRLFLQAMGPVQVVGVVGHVRHWGLAGDDQAQVRDQLYYPLSRLPDRLMRLFSSILSLTVRTNLPPMSILQPLRQELHGPAGDQVLYEVHTMEEVASASLARQRFLVLLFGTFAGLALLLACLGIYGVLSYLTSQRLPEIGIRMALGANARDIIRLVVRQSLAMIFAGIASGLVASMAAGRVLLHVVEGMRAMEVSTVVGMVSILLMAALLASFLPARRASRLDAIQALRTE